MTKKELLNHVYEKYNLTSEDVFKHSQGWVIFTRSGVEKIQAVDNITVTYDVVVMEREYAVIKAKTTKVETFGSASIGGFGVGTTKSHYIAEMAEKRALSRAILKHTGMYQHGAFGEDEADDFADDRQHVPGNIFSRAMSAVIKGDISAEEAIKSIEEKYHIGESQIDALKRVKVNKIEE